MAWNYKHNTTLPNGTIINAPDDTLRGNVCYIAKNGYINQAAVSAVNASAQIGSADFPYLSFTIYKADIATHSIYSSVIGKGEYTDQNLGDLTNYDLTSDEKYAAKFQGNGSAVFATRVGSSLVGGVITKSFNYLWVTGYAVANGIRYNFLNCIIDFIHAPESHHTMKRCVFLADIQYYNTGDFYFNGALFYNVNADISGNNVVVENAIFFNTVTKASSIARLNKNTNIFWNGSIQVGASTYDISAAISAGKTEATIQTEIGTLFSVTFQGRIINPHFINAAKGNLNMDYINYATDVAKILTAQVSYPNVAKRGVKCEWDAVLATSDFIFSASSPHYSALDGFNGLICRNLNADGSIVNTAYDTVAVSKIITLPLVAVLDFLLQFGTFGAGALEWDELYVRAVASGAVEDEYSIASGYKASYTANVFTCDWPRFYLNREQKCNKVGDKALGSIDKGAYNLDEARSIFKTGAIEFQFILVKRGV
jgi:hypothetical protein